MRFNRIADLARQAIDKRGGIDALKQDLGEVRDVATGRGTLREKARAAADALRQPGRPEAKAPDAAPVPAPDPDAPAEAKVHPDPEAPPAHDVV